MMRRFLPCAARSTPALARPMRRANSHQTHRVALGNHFFIAQVQLNLIPRRNIFELSTPEWHRPSFMQDASIDEKEAWLESTIDGDSRLDAQAFLVVLKHLATSSEAGSPQKAEGWLRRLETRASSNPLSLPLQPTVECYNAVICSWANSREDTSLSLIRAERWISKLIKKSEVGGPQSNVTATTETYNAFLDACSRGHGARRNAPIAREHAKKAQETLEYMIQQQEQLGADSPVIPNTESFNFVIRAWTRCRDEPPVANHVMGILKQMTNYQRQDPKHSPVLPNTQSYTMVMDAFATAGGLQATTCQKKGSPQDRNDPSKNGLKEVEMMEDLLKYMHKLHEIGGLDYVVPNTVTYNVLISAWARLSGPLHPKAPLQAEKVLRKMIALREDLHPEVAPDALSYTKVIVAWTNLGKDTAGKRAQWWLEKLHEEYDVSNDERLRPSVSAYNAAIKAWTKVGRPENAEKLLVDLLRHEQKKTIPFLKTNSESFSIVIHAWVKSNTTNDSDAGQQDKGCRRAAKWLEELARREAAGSYGVTTSPELFDGVLKAASKCSDARGPELLDFSISIFEAYRASRHRTNFTAYVCVLKVGLNTLGTAEYDDTRFDFIQQLVEDCCEDGLLSNLFVRTLANGQVYYDGWTRGESARLVEELFPEWPLPWEWSRNVPAEHYVPRRQDAERRNAEIQMRDGHARSHG